jgi:hypothetical protein
MSRESPDPLAAAALGKMTWLIVPVVALSLLIGLRNGEAHAADSGPPAPGDRALIVVGLSGDDEHADRFRETAKTWRQWLTDSLVFPADGIRVVFGAAGDPSLDAGPATKQAIAAEVETIRRGLAAQGRLWVFFLGHGNELGGHAFLHLPGPDLREDELGQLFKDIHCREQVFWITNSASGWFLAPLSAKGRIVITATSPDREPNETEFPHALALVSRRSQSELDKDGDGKISVWELFVATVAATMDRFADDERAPTEHALLDDNGDKVGTEPPEPATKSPVEEKSAGNESRDGAVAKTTFVPLKTQ